MIDTIASIYVFIEAYWRFGLFVAIVFGVFWLFTNLQTDKPLGLLNQLAYGVWVVVKYTALGIWWVLKKAFFNDTATPEIYTRPGEYRRRVTG